MFKSVLIFAAPFVVMHEAPEATNAGQKSSFDTSQERELLSGRVKRRSGTLLTERHETWETLLF